MSSKKTRDDNQISSRISSTLVVLLISLFITVVGYIYLAVVRDFTFPDLVESVVGNLLGVFAAFILFDIAYNMLTAKESAREVSQHITKTLMGDPDTLDAFSEEDKRKFIESTVKSIVNDEDCTDMVSDSINRLLDLAHESRVRTEFRYNIIATTEFSSNYANFPGVAENKYFYVEEKFDYTVKSLTGKVKNFENNRIKIGFSFEKKILDYGLNETATFHPDLSECIFNESLEITSEAQLYLAKLSAKELKDVFVKLFTPVLSIDGKKCEISEVSMSDTSLIAGFFTDFDETSSEHAVRLVFHMPRLWNSLFEIAIIDPTRNPQISFDYNPDKMNVTMYSFLDKKDSSNSDANESRNGLFDIDIRNKWIYPKSGIVFDVREITGNDGDK